MAAGARAGVAGQGGADSQAPPGAPPTAPTARTSQHRCCQLTAHCAPFARQVEADIAALKELAKQGKTQEAVDGLLAVEKAQRLAEDVVGTRLACLAVLEVRALECGGVGWHPAGLPGRPGGAFVCVWLVGAPLAVAWGIGCLGG